MSSEGALWQTTKRSLGPYGRLKRIESFIEKGTPDVAYTIKRVSGWIELKHLGAYPVRDATPVCIPKLTLEQVQWCEAETAIGGRSFVLLQAEHDYMLLAADTVRALFERELPKADLVHRSIVYSRGGFLAMRPLIEVLTR